MPRRGEGGNCARVFGIVRVMPTITRKVIAPHGERARYVHRSQPCRCARCRRANAIYQARYRAGETGHRDDTWQPHSWRQLTLPGVTTR